MPHSILLDGREVHLPTNRTLIITESRNSDLPQSQSKQQNPSSIMQDLGHIHLGQSIPRMADYH